MRAPLAPQSRGLTRALLHAADHHPRRECELIGRARAQGYAVPGGITTVLHRLVSRGSLAWEGVRGRPHYRLTPRGEQHARALEAALPTRLCRMLVLLTRSPQPTARLAEVYRTRHDTHPRAGYEVLGRLRALDLAVLHRQGKRTSYALTEMGDFTLPEAHEVLAFLEVGCAAD